ncbi:uncharacterized protein L201_008067 [Kwoniella dendrophila CBS 6074]|uniref:Sensor domain-containing protein n=1 Tax=Kwoniella dendrophila CBS 6074 TaxID=1295534 RepID=A0AAX4K5W8_9TREE
MSQSMHLPSNPTSPIPKPPRLLPRSPSDPLHLSGIPSGSSHNHSQSNGRQQQPIYVLTADGSSLFLLDPSKPRGGEEPPPYASFPIIPSSRTIEEGPGVIRPNSSLDIVSQNQHQHQHHPYHRDRARTLSAINTENNNYSSNSLHRPRYTSTQSYSSNTTSSRRSRSALSSPHVHTSSLINPIDNVNINENTPLLSVSTSNNTNIDQQTVISLIKTKKRGLWRSIWCGDLDFDEEPGTRFRGFKRFWRPIGRSEYWKATLHLVLLNFPLALFVWPFLVAGTLAGTVLLITLPLGAAVWWLTLFISRSAARLESIMQLHYHSPISPASPPSNHPIFYRLILKPSITPPVITPLSSPTSPYPETPGLDQGELEEGQGQGISADENSYSTLQQQNQSSNNNNNNNCDGEDDTNNNSMIWEKRFMKCSYAMFLDHYSYSALTYFLLIKPLITLFSTILIIILFPIGIGTIFGLPIYLRMLRKFGKWQAEVAIENL